MTFDFTAIYEALARIEWSASDTCDMQVTPLREALAAVQGHIAGRMIEFDRLAASLINSIGNSGVSNADALRLHECYCRVARTQEILRAASVNAATVVSLTEMSIRLSNPLCSLPAEVPTVPEVPETPEKKGKAKPGVVPAGKPDLRAPSKSLH